jgi:undecaprenyl-diphosphatase
MDGFGAAALLGFVEGVTEFLPVSSTAHLRLAEKLLGLSLEDGYWKMFSIVIQLGAVLCLPVYFYARIVAFVKSFLAGPGRLRHPFTLVMVAFIVTAVPSFLLLKQIGKNLESPLVMALSLIIGGIVMGLVDRMKAKAESAGPSPENKAVRTWRMENMTLTQACMIGLCQVTAAVFPGVSRSMATIAGGQLMGLSRAAALEFSFFLSMPTMAAATGYTLLKALRGDAANPIGAAQITQAQWGMLGVGFVVSFIVAYASVAFLMHWVRKRGLMPFALYRVTAGLAIFAFLL